MFGLKTFCVSEGFSICSLYVTYFLSNGIMLFHARGMTFDTEMEIVNLVQLDPIPSTR